MMTDDDLFAEGLLLPAMFEDPTMTLGAMLDTLAHSAAIATSAATALSSVGEPDSPPFRTQTTLPTYSPVPLQVGEALPLRLEAPLPLPCAVTEAKAGLGRSGGAAAATAIVTTMLPPRARAASLVPSLPAAKPVSASTTQPAKCSVAAAARSLPGFPTSVMTHLPAMSAATAAAARARSTGLVKDAFAMAPASPLPFPPTHTSSPPNATARKKRKTLGEEREELEHKAQRLEAEGAEGRATLREARTQLAGLAPLLRQILRANTATAALLLGD